ncbi:MAG: hypothetical protein GY795_47970 [Desulfobacterales bacterium]|nr:hypothetical protein [Desulfobacterales bacterium]
MKRRNREFNIFNLSMLDVFASAMGAFLIIMVILLPYYNKDAQSMQEQIDRLRQQVAQQRQQLEQQQQRIQQLEQTVRQHEQTIREQQQTIEQQKQTIREQQDKIEQLENQNQNLRERLENTFLIVVISWNNKDDIDLHVVDPAGHEFHYKQKSFPGVPGELSEDTIDGPGVEVWEVSKAPPGEYKVYYNLYAKRDSSSSLVKGRVYFRDGRKFFKEKTLTQQKQKPLVATVTVKSDGQVSIQLH